MEQVTICSKNDLSELGFLMRNQFSRKHFVFQQKVNGVDSFTLDKKDLPEISGPVADWINKSFCKDKINQILYQKYDILTEDEKFRISLTAVNRLKEENQDLVDMIRDKLLELFEISDRVNLEGFVTFCLQEYQAELEILIDECLDEYLAEQDYLEFLDLLSYFVEVEDCRFGNLSIVAQSDGSYRYYDENSREITRECMEEFMEEFADDEVDHDDLLVSILIILLPERISLFGAEHIRNKNLLKTLQIIFEKRIKLYQHASAFTRQEL